MFEARSFTGKIALQLVLSLLVLPFLLPLIAMAQGSLQGQGWDNYLAVLKVPQFVYFFRNSAIIAALTISIVYVCTTLAAFAFSKFYIRGKEIYFWMMLVALTLPEVVVITPLFSIDARLNLYNTYWAVVLPLAALQIPFTVLLTRSFINGIPDALFDAARIDGAGIWAALRYIIVPFTRPIAASVVILTLIAAWNSYLLPLVLLQDPSYQVVTQLPQYFQGTFTNDPTKVLASAVVTAIPEVAAYLCLQRFFERGLAAGALK